MGFEYKEIREISVPSISSNLSKWGGIISGRTYSILKHTLYRFERKGHKHLELSLGEI